MEKNLMALNWLKVSQLLIVISIGPLCYTQTTYYITPSHDLPCPGEPCHTLSQYADQYFQDFSSNTTLLFLPGDHILDYTISMGTASKYIEPYRHTTEIYIPKYNYSHPSLTLVGSLSSIPVTSRIICTWPAGFTFSGITNLEINALVFISCGHNDSAAMNIVSVSNSSISNCTFQNSINSLVFSPDSKGWSGGAIYVHESTLTLTQNKFYTNTAYVGGALEVYTNSILILNGNSFQRNIADFGGAVDVWWNSTIVFTRNTFYNNSVPTGPGGALYADINNTVIFSENIFQNNYAEFGAALYVQMNNAVTLVNNSFHNNTADKGGALYAYINNTFTMLVNAFEDNSAVYGGALLVFENNTLTLTENTFQSNFANDQGGSLFIYTSNVITLSCNTFQYNSAILAGGALYVHAGNTLSLSENTFHTNLANTGGVCYVYTNSTLTFLKNVFWENYAGTSGGALYVEVNNSLYFLKDHYLDNTADFHGGALYVFSNNALHVSENTFHNNSAIIAGGAFSVRMNNILTLTQNVLQNNSAGQGGGVLYEHENNTLALFDNFFLNNYAGFAGGALCIHSQSNLTISMNMFQNNFADNFGIGVYKFGNSSIAFLQDLNISTSLGGGALFVHANNTLMLTGNLFQSNSAGIGGGALYVHINNTLTISENTFQSNSANGGGGALYVYKNNTIVLLENTLRNNSADNTGGAIMVFDNCSLSLLENTIHSNYASKAGGALYVYMTSTLNISKNVFEKNSANYYGGGALYVRQSVMNLNDNNLISNSAQSHGGAVVCVGNSHMNVYGVHILWNNTALYGGGIAALDCHMMLSGNASFTTNKAIFGGGLYAYKLQVTGYADFVNNLALKDGGGGYASRSMFSFEQNVTFDKNSALNGGGLLLTGESKIFLQPDTKLNFTNNHAKQKGGALKVDESHLSNFCVEESCYFLTGSDCFFQIQTQKQYNIVGNNVTNISELNNIRIYFRNNTAIEAGATLYGGLVDSCSLTFINQQIYHKFVELYICPNSGIVFDYITNAEDMSLDISSDPLYICICEGDEADCTIPSIERTVYPGSTVGIPVIAYGQRNGTTPAVIHTITPRGENTIDINDLESIQNISNHCTSLKYTMQTRAVGTSQEMTLYTEGYCPPRERIDSSIPTNIVRVNVTILECPTGFELSGTEPTCNCAQRLQLFTNECIINDKTIARDTEFWVGFTQDNTSDGLILHSHCPFHYCTSKKVYIDIDSSDKQCSNNRKGLLCGQCVRNFSIVLGSSRCLQCSNHYLWLTLPFAFAGIALVLLLLILRLTVAVGTINGLVFYANILAVNSATFLPSQNTNILTVFIAWINLDLGIETCFYDGMSTYAKVWLQFAFSLYVWALVITITIVSHYSIRLSSILGNSTIEVLATLILLSYAKLLRTVIAALSYTLLDYPNNSQIAVWLYDANIRYLSGKHIPLFTAALVSLVFLFLPFTILLTFGQWFRAQSEWRIFSWANNYRVLPFLEAYHAPYTDGHRYWTGLMLLVRGILFMIFAFNALGDPNVNLLCIALTATILLILSGKKVFKSWSLNVLEQSFNTNLLTLTLATLYINAAGGDQNAIAYISISLAFTTFFGIVIYHSVQQIKATPKLWRRLFPQHNYDPVPQTAEDSELEGRAPPSPPDPSDGSATVTHINFRELLAVNELREPCMEMDD